MPTQNVNLTDELETFVKSQVASGHYNSISEVHRAALKEMAQREQERVLRLRQLRQEIKLGVSDLDAGRAEDFSTHAALDEHLDRILGEVLAESEQA